MKNNHISMMFNQAQNIDDWQVTNDNVMGGLSEGRAQFENQSVIFSGSISTENNGGFTCVFIKTPEMSDDIKSVKIRIIGDGHCYQLRVRSQVSGYDIAYKKDFKTPVKKVATICFNFADFIATFRGRELDNAPILKASMISSIGFLITARQAHKFSLLIDVMEFY